MATELAAGYVSLTVKLAKESMGDVNKEVKKAGKEGGSSYSDEFNKQVSADGKKIRDTIEKVTKGGDGLGKAAKGAAIEFGKGMLDGIQDALGAGGTGSIADSIGKATKSGGGVTKAAKDAAGEFGKGFRDGVKDAIRTGDIEGALTPINDKIRTTTGLIQSIGGAVGMDTSGITNLSTNITNALGDIETRVGNVKTSFGELDTTIGQLSSPGGIPLKIGLISDAIGTINDIKAQSEDANTWAEEHISWYKWMNQYTPDQLGKMARDRWDAFYQNINPTDVPSLPNTPTIPPGAPNAGQPVPGEHTGPGGKRAPASPAELAIYGPGNTVPNSVPLPPKNQRLPGHATGGVVSGPGGTDNVLSWLTAGEGVVKKSAMQGGGAAIVAALNRQGGIPGFAEGTPPDVLAALGLVGTPYSQAARNDCSGTVAQVINSVLGMSGSGLMSTKTAASWLAARGFVKGRGGPGQISVGWYDHGPNPNDGHMAMTLSNGQPAEAGGSHGQFLVGAGAKGADWGSFDQHMYLPTLFGEGPAGSSSVGSAAAGSGGGGGGGGSTAGGGGGGGISDNPYKALQQINQQRAELDKQTGEQVRKIMPDFGQLADIGVGGLKETFLPPGFSDPTQWKSTKSVGALLSFIGNISGDPAAQSILGGIGAGITGSGSGLYSGIMGAIPQPFGTLQQQQPAVGDFPAAAGQHLGTGAPPGPGQVPVPGALGPGPTGPAINIENVNEPAGTAINKANQLNNFQTAAQKQDLVRR